MIEPPVPPPPDHFILGETEEPTFTARNITLGWIALLVIFSPLVVGFILDGEKGLMAGLLVWCGLLVGLCLMAVAAVIGSIIRRR